VRPDLYAQAVALLVMVGLGPTIHEFLSERRILPTHIWALSYGFAGYSWMVVPSTTMTIWVAASQLRKEGAARPCAGPGSEGDGRQKFI
jgi:hypothetical protein